MLLGIRTLAAIGLASMSCLAGEPKSSLGPPRASLALVSATPRAAELQVQHLAVPGFLPAVLVVPAGEAPAPLVVAAHGAGGAPEWECDYWMRLTRGRAFVLCLRGTRINPRAGFYFRDHHALDAELTSAKAEALRRFPRIAPGSGIFAGFSQGASMGALIVSKHARELPYVVLIEGFQQWNVALGRRFSAQGGKAVLLACGTRECAETAELSEQALRRAGSRVRAEHAPGAGHTPAGPVQAMVASSLPWLTKGDTAWPFMRTGMDPARE